ncbi:unnamed protein product [Ectocarpus sp. 8 AP-2014]
MAPRDRRHVCHRLLLCCPNDVAVPKGVNPCSSTRFSVAGAAARSVVNKLVWPSFAAVCSADPYGLPRRLGFAPHLSSSRTMHNRRSSSPSKHATWSALQPTPSGVLGSAPALRTHCRAGILLPMAAAETSPSPFGILDRMLQLSFMFILKNSEDEAKEADKSTPFPIRSLIIPTWP